MDTDEYLTPKVPGTARPAGAPKRHSTDKVGSLAPLSQRGQVEETSAGAPEKKRGEEKEGLRELPPLKDLRGIEVERSSKSRSPDLEAKRHGPEDLLHLADQLWRLGQEQRHAATKKGTAVDEHLRKLREALLRIADELPDTSSGRRSPGGGGSAPDYDANSADIAAQLRRELAVRELKCETLEKTTTAQENKRLRKELRDTSGKVKAMEQTFIAYVGERTKAKQRSDWLRNYGLMGRYNLNNMTVVLQVCQAWSNAVANEKFLRKAVASHRDQKELASTTRIKTLDYVKKKEDNALLDLCMYMWVATMGQARMERKLEETMGKLVDARQATRNTLGNMFGGNSEKAKHALLDEVFQFWHQNLREAKLFGKLENEKQALVDAAERFKEDKRHMAERFGKIAMAQMEKQLSAGAAGIMGSVVSEWLNVMKFEKERDLREQEILKAKQAQRDEKMKAIEMALGKNGAKLQQQAFYEYVSAVQNQKLEKKKRDEAMAKGLRAISGGDYAMKNLFFDSWGKAMVEGRTERARLLAEEEAKAKALHDRAHKLKSVQASLASKEKDLLREVHDAWVEQVKFGKKRDKLKQGVLRGIAEGDQMLVSGVYFEWIKITKADREMAQERGRRRRQAEMGRAIIIKLREHLILRCAWDGWLIRTLI